MDDQILELVKASIQGMRASGQPITSVEAAEAALEDAMAVMAEAKKRGVV